MKPAVPLEAVPHRDPDEGDAMAVVYCHSFEHAVRTADYITRAANAHHDLLESLYWMANLAEEAIEARKASDDPEDHETLDLHEASLDKARALLAKLRP